MSSTEPRLAGLDVASVAAIVYATSLAIVMLNISPAAELQLRQEAGLSVGQVGALYFVELAAMGLATLPAYAWLGRVDATRVARAAYVLFATGSALSAWLMNSYPLLVAARGLTGIGAGTLMVLGMTTGALARDRNRMYATITFGQLASGAAALYVLPALSADGRGLRGVFYLSALLGVLGLLGARPFAALGARVAVPRQRKFAGPRSELRSTLLAIAFAMVFNTVIGGLWAFAGEYTTDADMSPSRITQVLTYSTLVGLAGAAMAFGIGGRLAHRSLLLVGFLAIGVGSSLLHLVRGDAGFAAGCYVLSFGWNFSVPFIFAAVAAQDTSGRSVPSMNLAFAFGLAIGPLLAGTVVEFAGLGALVPCMLVGLALGTVLMFRVTRQSAPR
ncbi:MAG: MFS transporter [Burkholderiaceae bacterium]